ncbi:hypothetical protein Hamer_G028112, partial [Homarus americanus]
KTGEASRVNVAESRSVNDELHLLESQIKLKEAEAKAKEVVIRQEEAEAKAKEVGIPPRSRFSHFDPTRSARLMPTFSEETVDEFFIAFERLATTLEWPINFVNDRRSWTRSPPNGASKFSTYTCSFCGKPGHKAEFCWTRLQLNTGKPAMIVTEEANTSQVGVMAGLSKADSMPIALVSTKGEARESAVSVLASRDFDLLQESFAKDPDVGTVEDDGVETPVTILRDSGCLQTLIKEGIANVACVHELPVAGVDLILGNDLAGGQMGNVTPPPVLRERPESTAELQQLEDDMPGVFPLCAVTRSMSVTNDHNVTPDVDDSLSLEGLFVNPIASQDISSAVNAVTGRVALIARRFITALVSDSANDSGPTTRYFSQDGVFVPPLASTDYDASLAPG